MAGDEQGEMTDATASTAGREIWRAIGDVITAHVVMLCEVAVLDDAAGAALLRALDGVTAGEPAPASTPSALVTAFDERLDAVTAAGIVGGGGVGRVRGEVVATVARLLLRHELLDLADATERTRHALLDLADAQLFTLMPAFSGGQAAQPTTLAHFLGGIIAPLGRAGTRLQRSYATVNQSPLGAAALASVGLPIDRERTADLLGCDAPIANTLDALSAVDHLVETMETASVIAANLRRFVAEWLAWLRAEPQAFRLAEGWLAPSDPALPHLRPPSGLEQLVVDARRIEGEAAAIARIASEAPYGPINVTLESVLEPARLLLAEAAGLAERVARLVAEIEINRAYLGNRAGRDHTTSSDLADFLIAEESLEPASARSIAQMTVRKAIETGIETSGITPEMIDASALLILGRELGVEREGLGRFLAPRRLLERRGALGGPAPDATRRYLSLERTRLLADHRWQVSARERNEAAAQTREQASAAILSLVD